MNSNRTPIAILPENPIDLLQWLLRNCDAPTTLVICSDRDSFLDYLSTFVEATRDPETGEIAPCSLLTPRIHLISSSQKIKILFTPSLAHLRAYLCAVAVESSNESINTEDSLGVGKAKKKARFLVIWGLAAIHRSTLEHSAQGLSRTMAAAVEAADGLRRRLLLAETHAPDLLLEEEGDSGRQASAWREQIPLLSGSVRFGGEHRGWGVKTIEVGAVVEKWCRFASLGELEETLR